MNHSCSHSNFRGRSASSSVNYTTANLSHHHRFGLRVCGMHIIEPKLLAQNLRTILQKVCIFSLENNALLLHYEKL